MCIRDRGKGASGRRQREKGSVSAELWFFFFLFFLAVNGDVVLVLRLPVLCRDSDAEQGIAAARTKILAVDAVGSSFGHLRCERHGGNFKRHRQTVLVNLRVKGRGKVASGRRQREKGSVSAEFRLFLLDVYKIQHETRPTLLQVFLPHHSWPAMKARNIGMAKDFLPPFWTKPNRSELMRLLQVSSSNLFRHV